jgi:hypothetical protein
LEGRTAVFRVGYALIRELALSFPFPICRYLLLCNRIDILLKFPGAVLVMETTPFAEVLHISFSAFTVSDDALDDPEGLQVFLFALPVEMKSFHIFP